MVNTNRDHFCVPGMGKMLIDSIKAANNARDCWTDIYFTVLSIISPLLGEIAMALVDHASNHRSQKVSKCKLLINLSLNLLVAIAVLRRLSYTDLFLLEIGCSSSFQKNQPSDARHFVSDFIDELYLSHGLCFMILVMSVLLMTFLSAIFG